MTRFLNTNNKTGMTPHTAIVQSHFEGLMQTNIDGLVQERRNSIANPSILVHFIIKVALSDLVIPILRRL